MSIVLMICKTTSLVMMILLCPLLIAMTMIGVIMLLMILKIYLSLMKNILFDSYIVEFYYDPTCNYYERGKYGCRNFHVTNLPLVMLRLPMFYSSSLHTLVF